MREGGCYGRTCVNRLEEAHHGPTSLPQDTSWDTRDVKASPPWTRLQRRVCHIHLPLDVAHQPVEALLSLLWSQSGVTHHVLHDVEVRTHLVGQTCHTGILLISSNLTDRLS